MGDKQNVPTPKQLLYVLNNDLQPDVVVHRAVTNAILNNGMCEITGYPLDVASVLTKSRACGKGVITLVMAFAQIDKLASNTQVKVQVLSNTGTAHNMSHKFSEKTEGFGRTLIMYKSKTTVQDLVKLGVVQNSQFDAFVTLGIQKVLFNTKTKNANCSFIPEISWVCSPSALTKTGTAMQILEDTPPEMLLTAMQHANAKLSKNVGALSGTCKSHLEQNLGHFVEYVRNQHKN